MAKSSPSVPKGIQTLILSLPLFFLGPGVFNMALKNKEHPYYIPILILGVLLLCAAVFVAVTGIRLIMKALFEDK